MIASGLAIGLVAAIALAATWKPAAIIVIGPAVLALWKLVKLSRVDGRIQPRTWGAICASALVAAAAIAAQPNLERRAVPTGRDELVRNLGTAISAGDRVALATVPGFDFAWDHVHFIGAYTGRTAVVERLGTSPGFGWSSRVHSNDGITLVVFLNEGRAMTYFDFPANLGSLQPLTTRTAGFARQESVFTVRRLPNGWVELRPQE